MAGGKETPRQKNDRDDVPGTHGTISLERIQVHSRCLCEYRREYSGR